MTDEAESGNLRIKHVILLQGYSAAALVPWSPFSNTASAPLTTLHSSTPLSMPTLSGWFCAMARWWGGRWTLRGLDSSSTPRASAQTNHRTWHRLTRARKVRQGPLSLGLFHKERLIQKCFSQHTICDFLTVSFPFPGPQPSDSPTVLLMMGQWLCNKSLSPSREFAFLFPTCFIKYFFPFSVLFPWNNKHRHKVWGWVVSECHPVPTVPTMQRTHWVTYMEAIFQITFKFK